MRGRAITETVPVLAIARSAKVGRREIASPTCAPMIRPGSLKLGRTGYSGRDDRLVRHTPERPEDLVRISVVALGHGLDRM